MAEVTRPDIGKYHIIELVGEGAMGVVYRAIDSILDRTVAVKVMNESIARQEDLRKRFLHEAQAAASLQHPNVVSIYDLGEVDGHMFIAMEFVDGVDLEKLLELGQPLSLQARLDIVIDVLTGLTFAHKRGIVHRDIKPANIRVTEDGRAKIMDFGVAHLASSSMTSTGSFLGTPSYMAPEQITEGKTTPQTDIFAVGGVLYQLLTQMKPFEAPTLQNLFFRIITEHPKPVSELMPGLPPALDHIVEKAMAKEPTDRYKSALEMANDLSAVRAKLSGPSYPESVSLSASVSSAIEMARKKQSRTRTFAIAGAGALVGVLAIVLVSQVMKMRGASPQPTQTVAAMTTLPATQQPAGAPAASLAENATTSPASPSLPQPPAATPEKATLSAPGTPVYRGSHVVSPPRVTPPKVAPQKLGPQKAATRTTTQSPLTVPSPTTQLATQAPVQTAVQNPAVQQQVVTQQSPPAAAVQRPVETKPEPPPAPPPGPPSSADLAGTVEAYARAIESKDIGAVRRANSGLTSEQQKRWETFFQAARSINVTFRIASIDGTASQADARLIGSYEYVDANGTSHREPDNITASFRHEGGSWRLVAVR
jgi:serine/threonine-protein kinase